MAIQHFEMHLCSLPEAYFYVSFIWGGEFAIYCFHRFLGVFLSMSSVHLSRFGFCRERVRTKR